MSEATQRADRSKAILENPAFSEAFEGVRLAIHRKIEECPLGDTETAEDLRKCLKLLKDVRLQLVTFMNTGKIEADRIEKAEARRRNPLFGSYFR